MIYHAMNNCEGNSKIRYRWPHRVNHRLIISSWSCDYSVLQNLPRKRMPFWSNNVLGEWTKHVSMWLEILICTHRNIVRFQKCISFMTDNACRQLRNAKSSQLLFRLPFHLIFVWNAEKQCWFSKILLRLFQNSSVRNWISAELKYYALLLWKKNLLITKREYLSQTWFNEQINEF